jgi:hypothetical protein
VALVLQEKAVNAEQLLPSIADWAATIEPDFATELMNLIKWVSMPPERAVTFISKAGIDADYLDEDGWKGITPFVISSVLWSLYSFLRTPDDYWETICTAIAVGGDVDTTAAMAGAISGAYLGLGAIPSDLSKCLADRGTWGFDELVELAHLCYKIRMQNVQ